MNKIIVPIDFSEHSEYALEAAAIIAQKHDAEIMALHMLEISDAILTHASGEQQSKAFFLLKLAEKRFEDFLKKEYLEGIKVSPIVKHFKVFSEVNDVAKEQNDRLTSFARIVTHNLRSHVGNLSTITEFLEDDIENLDSIENYKLLKNALDSLQETVSHLAEVAKIKKAEDSDMQSLNLYNYVQKAMYSVIAMAQSANAIIYNEIDEEQRVMAVPAYLESVILNFLTNAIKYRSKKRIPVIEMSSCLEDDYVHFKINDNGLGMDMEKYGDKVFQMYKTFHKNPDSIGVGLFITKNHIESMGGKVEVTSDVDVGTEFSVYLKKG